MSKTAKVIFEAGTFFIQVKDLWNTPVDDIDALIKEKVHAICMHILDDLIADNYEVTFRDSDLPVKVPETDRAVFEMGCHVNMHLDMPKSVEDTINECAKEKEKETGDPEH